MFLTAFPLYMQKNVITPVNLRSFLKIDMIESITKTIDSIKKTDDRIPNPAPLLFIPIKEIR